MESTFDLVSAANGNRAQSCPPCSNSLRELSVTKTARILPLLLSIGRNFPYNYGHPLRLISALLPYVPQISVHLSPSVVHRITVGSAC
jgi:hypothetical protein